MIEPVSLDMACGAAYLSVNTQWGVTADLESVSVQLLVHGDLSCCVETIGVQEVGQPSTRSSTDVVRWNVIYNQA